MKTELLDIFNKYGCDKGKKHRYDLMYTELFESKRSSELNILEIGIFRGESISSWIEYFPKATIYGVDIFTRVPPENVSILTNPRVKWVKCNSMNANIASKIWADVKFDFIIDDGLHTPLANKLTFEAWSPKLAPTGTYIIEDIFPLDIMTPEEKNNPWILSKPEDYSLQKHNELLETISKNHSYTIYDARRITGEPDSFSYKIVLNQQGTEI